MGANVPLRLCRESRLANLNDCDELSSREALGQRLESHDLLLALIAPPYDLEMLLAVGVRAPAHVQQADAPRGHLRGGGVEWRQGGEKLGVGSVLGVGCTGVWQGGAVRGGVSGWGCQGGG